MLKPEPVLNALSIDVEECFHASEMGVAPEHWPHMPSCVTAQTRRVLELLDRCSVKGTFFVLGWVARHHAGLVREIAAAGHEIGCHSYAHQLVYNLTPDEFRVDTEAAVNAIGEAVGQGPRIYRAPSYSITRRSLWALEILAECGFTHDSSIYPIAHDRYGIPGFGMFPQHVETPSGKLVEIPIAAVDVLGTRLPVGGGGYLRLLPYRYTAAGIRRINALYDQPACVYFHPWELDPDQARMGPGRISRLRTFTGVGGMAKKVEALLSDFRFDTIGAVCPHVN
jgi:polysaccharide deacetylase family protein (PEP-CTERM system associated)